MPLKKCIQKNYNQGYNMNNNTNDDNSWRT